MVLESLMGSAWAAYAYNQGRFQFDAGQKQTSAHQMINMRVQQWSLFREDIRDLFNLTTSHMSTYMVVGTLFLGFSVSFMWSDLKGFPADPPWLKLLWVNCFISAMCYGFLAVWLAMHGAIAAQSASVQLLTRAIRPPYPDAQELRRAQFELAQYEAAGVRKFFRPPQLVPGATVGAGAASRGSIQALQDARPEALRHDSRAELAPDVPDAPDGLGLGKDSQSPWEFAPGVPAELGMHVKLFQQLQATFLPFDAYARVCLIAAASHLLPALSYYWIAHQRWELAGAIFSALTGSCMLMFTALVLYKLDFYVEKQRMWFFKCVVLCAPLVSCGAMETWSDERGYQAFHALVQWVLVVGTCCMHVAWKLLFVWEARPSKESLDLPMSFRSVRYLDVFGSLRRRRAAERKRFNEALRLRREQDGGMAMSPTHLPAEEVLGMIGEVLHANRKSAADPLRGSLLSEDEAALLECSKVRLMELGCSFEETALGYWLRRIHEGEDGTRSTCFVNTASLEVASSPSGRQLDVSELLVEVDKLLPPGEGSEFEESEYQAFEVEPEGTSTFGTSGGVPMAQRPQVPTLRRPGSSHGQSSMPWKYFMQITLATITVWLCTTLYCVCTVGRTSGMKRKLLQGKEGPWPHAAFVPSAVACDGQRLLLSDRFSVHSAASASAPLRFDRERRLELRSLGAARGRSWALEAGGLAVAELGSGRRWPAGGELRSMAVLEEDLARAGCGEVSWAVLGVRGAPEAEEVLVLCPHEELQELVPSRRVFHVLDGGETRGLHMTATHLWLLKQSVGLGAGAPAAWLVRENLETGEVDTHNLPKGRRWAAGLCGSGAGGSAGVVAAAFHEARRGAELWEFEG